MKSNRIVSVIIIVVICIGLLSGCVKKTGNELNQAEMRNIAEIAEYFAETAPSARF